jgi:hypothetical protein
MAEALHPGQGDPFYRGFKQGDVRVQRGIGGANDYFGLSLADQPGWKDRIQEVMSKTKNLPRNGIMIELTDPKSAWRSLRPGYEGDLEGAIDWIERQPEKAPPKEKK